MASAILMRYSARGRHGGLNYSSSLALLTLLFINVNGSNNVASDKQLADELKKISLDKEGFEKVKEIHRNWYFFALKALMGQVAKELLQTVDGESGERLKLCLKRIANTKDLKLTAICLTKTKRKWEKLLMARSVRHQSKDTVAFKQIPVKQHKWIKNAHILDFNKLVMSSSKRTAERKIYKNSNSKNRFKRSPYRLLLPKSDSDMLQVAKSETLPPLFEQTTKSPTHNVANLFVSLFGKLPAQELSRKWSTTYKKLTKLARILESNEKLPGARVYDTRIYDLVVGNNKRESFQRGAFSFWVFRIGPLFMLPKWKNESIMYSALSPDLSYEFHLCDGREISVPPFLKSMFDLVNSFKGSKNARILSPRIAPLTPDRTDSKGFLSPSLFPFYKDDTEEQLMPVPKKMEAAFKQCPES